MANVLSKTAAQMASDGYALVYGAGERCQMWSAVVGQDMKYRVFDSVGNRAMQVNTSGPEIVATFAVAVVVLDLVSISTATGPQKSAAQLCITAALDRL